MFKHLHKISRIILCTRLICVHIILFITFLFQEKTAADSIISGEDMEALGYLGCELEPDDIERVDVADLRTSTLHIAAKCCYDRFQMVAVGLKVIEQLGYVCMYGLKYLKIWTWRNVVIAI